MHVREFPAVALFLASEGLAWIRARHHVSELSLAQYWTASKCRFDRWGRALRDYREPAPKQSCRANWNSMRAVCEEVLVSEMLTRVWSGLAMMTDQAGGDAQSLCGSVLAGHVEISNRFLELLRTGRHAPPGPAAELNRLRRSVERWTDLLLASLSIAGDVGRYAHDRERMNEFAADFSGYDRLATRRQAWALLSTSLRGAFKNRPFGDTANGDLNGRIVDAIVGSFPHEAFDSSGAYRSLWLQRLTTSASDTEYLVEGLLADEQAASAPIQARWRSAKM